MKVSEFKGELPKSVAQSVVAGNGVFFGEFRTGIATEFSGKGGRVFKKSTCTVETATGVISVVEFLPDTMDVKAWKAPFDKGTMVFGEVRGWQTESGAIIAHARLLPA